MKNLIIILLPLLLLFTKSFGQKPVIDTSTINNWMTAADCKISGDGKYCWNLQFYSSHRKNGELSIGTVAPLREIVRIKNAASASFTADKNIIVFIKETDTLVLFNLSVKAFEYIQGVISYQLSPDKRWIAY
jgi:hypothetical protein